MSGPRGRGTDGGERWRTGVGAAAAFEAADGADRHIVAAGDLARQSGAGHAARVEHVLFGDRHLVRLPLDELYPASGAACVSTAGVEDVDMRILLDGKNQALARFDVHGGITFNCQLRHPRDHTGWQPGTSPER